MRKILCLGVLTLVLIVVLLPSGCDDPAESPDSELQERISTVENGLVLVQAITERMHHYNVPGVSIAVVDDFDLEWARGYGVLELGKDEPVGPDTLFQAASVSKPVTAVGALHYVDAGHLDLYEDVNGSLVSWRIPENDFTAQADVTLHRLLSHTAGVSQGLYAGYAPGEEIPTMQQILDGEPPANSPPVRVVRIPGTQESYSNGGYLIVAQLLEDVLGKPFEEIMQEAVFGPAGMTSSTFEQSLPADWVARAATAHGWDTDAWRESPGLVAPGKWHAQDVGLSGLWTTASDLARFAAEVMRARAGEPSSILSQETAELMLTPVAQGIPLQEPFDADQALGFSLLNLGGETFMIHFGGSFPGYISALVAQPETGFGVVVMTNAWSGYELIWEILYSTFYAYNVLPTTSQVLSMVYAGLLFLAMILLWPVAYVVRRLQARRVASDGTESRQGPVAVVAQILALLTVTAIAVVTFLYRGPLGGHMVHSPNTGEPPLTKALLAVFFVLPIVLVVVTALVWKKRCWSMWRRVYYTVIVLGTIVGVVLLRDLWGLMFWG
jgi:CubicO group peptidase (beta-lactamase class C family)